MPLVVVPTTGRGILAILYLLTIAHTSLAATRHVPSQFPTIQAAVSASTHGDEVFVAPGTYNEMIRPVGRPPKMPQRFYHNFEYRAGSWDHPRRDVAKVEWHRGELFPRIGFIVTNLRRSARRVVSFYNRRGTAEQWIKEDKNAVRWTRLSCRRFNDNQVRMQLFALAYNLGNFLRRLALPRAVKH